MSGHNPKPTTGDAMTALAVIIAVVGTAWLVFLGCLTSALYFLADGHRWAALLAVSWPVLCAACVAVCFARLRSR